MWSRFMAFLATLIFIAAGVLLLAMGGDIISLRECIYFIERGYSSLNMRFLLVSIGVGLLALGVFNIYFALIRFRKRSFVKVKGPQGEIQIALRAIEELVEKVSSEIGGIKKISTRVIPKRRKIALELRAFLGTVKNVVEISERLQESVKGEIESVLGVTNVGEVRVIVKRIDLEKKKSYEDILEEKRTSRGIELNR